MSSQWFQSAVPTSSGKKFSVDDAANNWPFNLKVGEEAKITFLNGDDDDIPPIHYHKVMFEGKVTRVACTAAEHLGGYCHFCEYAKTQPANQQWKTEKKAEYCYTILDDRMITKDNGEKVMPRKRLRLSTETDHKKILQIRETAIKKMGREGIQKVWIECQRPSDVDKAAAVGILGQILNDLDVSEYEEDYLKPFTFDEILAHFVTDPAEIAKIAAEYPIPAMSTGSSDGGIQINDAF